MYFHLFSLINLTVISRAFPKGHGSSNNADSDDDMVKIRTQHKKAVLHPSVCAGAKGTVFGTPPPEDPSLSVPPPDNPSIPPPNNPSIQPPDNPSTVTETTSYASSSTTSLSSVFSHGAAAALTMDDSNLSPCSSDNEAGAPVVSTSATASTPALAPLPVSHPSTDPVGLRRARKGHAPAAQATTGAKPRHQGSRKSNRF